MKRGFFVTGTGTSVGKTFVTALIAEHARAAGHRVFAFKPIETGCELERADACEGDGIWLNANSRSSLVGDDQELLARSAGDWQRGELRNLYCFERPLAPLAAARAEQRTIDLERVEEVFHRGVSMADLVLVEGAGGWRVPITETADMGKLAKRLGLPVVVVGTAHLGTINHSLLTMEAVRADGCEVALVVLSCHSTDNLDLARSNASEIQRLGGADVTLSSSVSRETWLRLLP